MARTKIRSRGIYKPRTRNVRPLRIEGAVAYVPLTRGAEAVIDAADAERVGRFNWHLSIKKNGHRYAEKHPCPVDREGMLHRFVILPDGAEFIDHRDRDGLNNRRSNLRKCTRSQNACNSKAPAGTKTGVKGVTVGRNGKFKAQIMVAGKAIFLGYFRSLEGAKAARDSAAVEHHGEFARSA